MKAKIALITVLTNDVPKMTRFYRDVLGFQTKLESDSYVEFENEGVRFSVCNRQIMANITDGHSSYLENSKGQSFELAFPCESAAEVHKAYDDLIAKGAIGIKGPSTMPWGQTTAFFADPEGNIHEIFAD